MIGDYNALNLKYQNFKKLHQKTLAQLNEVTPIKDNLQKENKQLESNQKLLNNEIISLKKIIFKSLTDHFHVIRGLSRQLKHYLKEEDQKLLAQEIKKLNAILIYVDSHNNTDKLNESVKSYESIGVKICDILARANIEIKKNVEAHISQKLSAQINQNLIQAFTKSENDLAQKKSDLQKELLRKESSLAEIQKEVETLKLMQSKMRKDQREALGIVL